MGISTYFVTPPPYVESGKWLSAYWVNELNKFIDTGAGFVYGANVARWTYPGVESVFSNENIYVLRHKYPVLRVVFRFTNVSTTLRIKLSRQDLTGGLTQVYSQSHSSGPQTIDITLATSGFSVANDELYFVRVEAERGTSTDLQYIERVEEVGAGEIDNPTPLLSTLSASTVVTATYLNNLLDAAKGLSNGLIPYNLPFVGVQTNQSQTRTATYLRYKLRHLNRYLHVGFKAANGGGGSDGVILYLNDAKVKGWGNNNTNNSDIFDMTALPNSIAEPSFGAEYELKFVVDKTDGVFKTNYLWELPYL